MDKKTELAIQLGQIIFTNTINGLREENEDLKSVIKGLLYIIDNPESKNSSHVCGPDAGCDGSCVDMSNANQLILYARNLIINMENL